MTTTLPKGITQAELDRYAALDAAMKKAAVEKTALNAKIKAAFPKIGTYVHGGIIVEITESVGLDKETAEIAFPFETFPQYYDTPKMAAKKVPESVKAEHFTITQNLSVKRAS